MSIPVNGPSDVGEAAPALCQSKVDVVCQIADNVTTSSFPAVARACEITRTPLFTFSPSLVKSGAMLGMGSDYAENGARRRSHCSPGDPRRAPVANSIPPIEQARAGG